MDQKDPATEQVLDRLREGIASWNAGALESAPVIWHDDIVWVEPPGFPDAGTHRGRDACVTRMRERLDLLGDIKVEVVGGEIRGERLFVEATVSGKGAASGAPAQQPEWWVYEFAEDRRIILWLEFLDRDQAEAALAA